MKIYKIEVLVNGEWIYRPWYGDIAGEGIEERLKELESDHAGSLLGFEAVRFVEIPYMDGIPNTSTTISLREYYEARINTGLNSLYCAGLLVPNAVNVPKPPVFPSADTWYEAIAEAEGRNTPEGIREANERLATIFASIPLQ